MVLMRYLRVENGQEPQVVAHPDWRRAEDGERLSDSELVEHGFFPIVDAAPEFQEDRERAVSLPLEDWVAEGDSWHVTYDVVPIETATLLRRRQGEVDQEMEDLIAEGFRVPDNVLRVAMDAESRTDLNAVASMAMLAINGLAEWPEGYSEGWISIENERIPLPTPEDGLALAKGVGDYYAQIRQHGRTVKDRLGDLASVEDRDGLLSHDISEGWPANGSPSPVTSGQ